MGKTRVIEVHSDTLSACEQWHSGQGSACYSVLSMGGAVDGEVAARAASEIRRGVERPGAVLSNNDVDIAYNAVQELEAIAEADAIESKDAL